jgi:hypothetical protein
MATPESKVVAHLCKRVAELGGFTRKVTYQGRDGAPDEWCFFPGGKLVIIECKAAGGRLAPIQVLEIRTLERYGFDAYIAWSKDDVDKIFKDFYA